jgi:crotonobetainyl-CoA:carnitine CoA-transferase CaiB-like acyl-CoA transferase
VGPYGTTAVAGADEPVRGSAGYGVFRCADGRYVALGVIAEDHFWNAVCRALGIDDLASLAYAERLRAVEQCNDAVAAKIAALPFDDVLARLEAAGAPVTPVLTPDEMGDSEHFRTRRVIVEAGDGTRRVGFPAQLHVHPARPPGPAPAPPAPTSG